MFEVLIVVIVLTNAAVVWAAWEMRLLRKALDKRRAVFFVMLCGGNANAQQKDFVGPPAPVEVRKLWTPAEAQAAALLDLNSLPLAERIVTRYVWICEPSQAAAQSVAATANRVGRGLIFRPTILAGNRLVRIRLVDLTRDVVKELSDLVEVWEELRFDPAFNLLLTPEALRVVLGLPAERQPSAIVRVEKGFEKRKLSDLSKADVVRVPDPTLPPLDGEALRNGTLSAAPIVSKEYFEFRATAALKGKGERAGQYNAVFSGLYYRFKGIGKSTEKGVSDLDFLLKQLGADSKGRADQRIAIKRSKITGKPRAVEMRATTTLRPGDGQPAVAITEDVNDESINPSQNAMETLNRNHFRPDGREVIWIDRNGMLAYALFDGEGNLVDEAPQTLVSDTTVPAQFTKRLQPAISCIRCHEAEGSDGWKPAINDVWRLHQRGLRVFGDAAESPLPFLGAIQTVQEQYRGDFDRFFKSARHQLQSATLEATGPWVSPAGPTGIVKSVAKRLEADVNNWWYGDVTPDVALREIGIAVTPKELSPQLLMRLLQPDPSGAAFGVVPENVHLGSLVLGDSISRAEWSFVQSYARSRALKELQQIQQQPVKEKK